MGVFDDKVAVVTGAAVGLGNTFARALAAEGASLAVCDVRDENADLADELDSPVMAVHADVSDADDVKRFIDGAIDYYGQIDILVSNAGVWRASLPTDDMDKTIDDYDVVVGTNLKGVFLCGRAVIPHMIERGSGEIINVNTDHLHTCGAPFEWDHGDAPDCPWQADGPRPTGGGPAMDLYDASKWGINGLTFGWSQALEPHNIRVNALCMGATDSYMLRSFHNFDPSPEEEASWMKAEDVARVMLELIQDGRTGENIGFAVGHPVVLPARRTNPYYIPGDPTRD
ncbi:MAG: SDR family oxidoreductase [Pseudomonadales bacterium]|jgi:NAD(P)-dependent dehydrogenase (short-subunit alcohol dehydrogenase family)|nr:SDR family oxidoreductase [Pseudomonadales bacterium]MDP6825493.1 SDR family oxidoreductase [Pseudomonadales bacterium]MDP6970487.1 SDR family oxidoreductase [Pseudomonadales bacterium]|tara:strand:- start:215 stop:1069 length:855 start_codon:yes stop_codon:yes gene_type:complete